MFQNFVNMILAPFYAGFNGLDIDGNYLQFGILLFIFFGVIGLIRDLIINNL